MLSDNVNRKFIASFDVDDYEILTDTGWEDCEKIHKTVEYTIWHVETETHKLACADTHIVFDENLNEVFVKDLKAGDKILTDNGIESIVTITETGDSDNMYDVELPEYSNHRYYTAGILSHNTTSYTIYALWLLCFYPDKAIMIAANKASTSIEIMGRIRLAYEYLPSWLKPAIVTYNKSEVTFSNNAKIHAFATSSDACRGWSAGCVTGDTMVTVLDTVTNKEFNISIEKLAMLMKVNETLDVELINVD